MVSGLQGPVMVSGLQGPVMVSGLQGPVMVSGHRRDLSSTQHRSSISYCHLTPSQRHRQMVVDIVDIVVSTTDELSVGDLGMNTS